MHGLRFSLSVIEPSMWGQDLRTIACPQCKIVQRHIIESAVTEAWVAPSPTRIKDALFAAGLKTAGAVREISDEALLSLPDFGKPSVAHLRETLGARRSPDDQEGRET